MATQRSPEYSQMMHSREDESGELISIKGGNVFLFTPPTS